jgi:hypothetical protein
VVLLPGLTGDGVVDETDTGSTVTVAVALAVA